MSQFSLPDFRQLVADSLKLWQVPGAAVAVVQDGQVLFSEGFGLRNLEQNLPVTADTLFPIASCTKAFTAMSAGLLVDEGRLEWDRPVRDYLPDFKLQDPFASERMSMRDLLIHRSGLPRHDMLWFLSNFNRRQIYERLRYLEPSKDFRAAYQYQNMMYMVAGYLVGEMAGMTWESFVQARIFERLGMARSNFSTVETRATDDYSLPYRNLDGQNKPVDFSENDGEKAAMGPAVSIVSCVNDLARWLQVHTGGGRFNGEQFISAANLAEMHRPQIVTSDEVRRQRFGFELPAYGLGWAMHAHKGKVVVEHGGNLVGFHALVSLVPDRHTGVVVLSNTVTNFLPEVLSYSIYDRLLALRVGETDWNGLFKPFLDEMRQAEKQSQAQAGEERIAGAGPSHALEDYLGEYEHPAYGVLAVRWAGEKLEIVFNDKVAVPLEHYHYDYFKAFLEDIEFLMRLSFTTDVKGNIAGFSVQLEPEVKEVYFARRPERALSDPAYLDQFTGEYIVTGLPMVVTLKGNTLSAALPGQPENLLVPYRGSEFQLKGRPGFSIQFMQDSGGHVIGAAVVQPGMVVEAVKKVVSRQSSVLS
jgi:CubicO group peptidase (beta-lactamase class C family)